MTDCQVNPYVYLFLGYSPSPNFVSFICLMFLNLLDIQEQETAMSHLTTPVKGQDSASSFVGSPSYSSPSSSSPLFSSPSFSSPSSRGKAESLVGYLVAVGPKQKSKKKNWYYVVHLQVSQTDLVQITMMESMSRGNPRREEFLPLVTQPLKFNNVYPGEKQSAYFYTQNQQSTWEVTEEQAFTLDDLTSPIELINTKTNGVFHVKGMLRWLDEVKPVTNGAYRFALIGDVSSHMRMKIWKEEWFKLDEEKVYLFTNLQVQEYFGFYLSTKYHSTYAETGEEITPSWPSDMDQYIVKIRTTTINNVEISVSWRQVSRCPALSRVQHAIIR